MTDALPITGVHHVARVTRQPQESVAFYRDVLGFRELQRPGFQFGGAWLFNYGVQIHIIENAEADFNPPGRIDSRSNHLALDVADIQAARRILDERGIEYREQVNAGGIRQIFFQDPDGHFVEIAEYPERPPEKRPPEKRPPEKASP